MLSMAVRCGLQTVSIHSMSSVDVVLASQGLRGLIGRLCKIRTKMCLPGMNADWMCMLAITSKSCRGLLFLVIDVVAQAKGLLTVTKV